MEETLCPKNLDKFAEYDQCLELIEELKTKLTDNAEDPRGRSDTERLIETFRKIIDKYQEQPELLEPYMPVLIERLTSSLSVIRQSSNKYHTVFKFLYQLIKVVGFKLIGKRFPHETDKLPLLVDLLSKEDPQDKINWQTRFVLTVWMSIVILTPFDLAKFDSDNVKTPISDRIYATLMKNLANHDSSQHVTAFCLAKFFSRPDMIKSDRLLNEFVAEALKELSEVKTTVASSMDDVKLIGYLRTLAYMFKFMPRDELIERSGGVLETLGKLDIQKINRELVNHLIIKLSQRVGLALLPKRVASWRYKRNSRLLGGQPVASADDQGKTSSSGSAPASEQTAKIDDVEMTNIEDEFKATAHLEAILSVLFVAAQAGQTKIRWSAAKGIARLASRLSRERAGDVVDMVLASFFDVSSNECAWHGGCLILAEMSRNGLIMEEKLPEVTRLVGDAIIYDKIKGSLAVGAHVREAACYVFWAMSRTYEDQLLQPYIQAISTNLLCTMLFDRELQCRRAASATFQELVGRQGAYNEEGISILTNVDYQSVGVRQFSYLELALRVGKHGKQYYEPFIMHLLDKKIGHWDVQIRRLATDSLCAFMLYPSEQFIRCDVLPKLCQMSEQNEDNNMKHGAILGLTKCIRSLVPLDYKFDNEMIHFLGNLGKTCEKQLKSKQQAPNFIEAMGNVLLAVEKAQFVYSDDSGPVKQWESVILSSLDSDNVQLREIGSDALLTLYRYVYGNNKTCQDRLLTILNKSLSSSNESTRCGALKSLSKLGLAISEANFGGEIRNDADTSDIILMSLTSYIAKETKETSPTATGMPTAVGASGCLIFAQAKADACEALVNFIKSLDKNRLVLSSQWLACSFDVLLEKSEDYTFDKRGDIGVVVRRAAIKALQDLTLFVQSIGLSESTLTSLLLTPVAQLTSTTSDNNNKRASSGGACNRLTSILARTLQQAVSYHNSTRELASQAFYKLIGYNENIEQNIDCIAHYKEILNLFNEFKVNDEFDWRNDSTELFINLLDKPEYSSDLWIGLLPAVGQISEVCAKQFRDSLANYIRANSGGRDEAKKKKKLDFVFESFLQTLEMKNLPGRLVTSGLITADYLLTQGLMNETSQDFQARLAQFTWSSAKSGSPGADPKRLVSISRVLCSMLQFSGQTQVNCLRKCLELLANGYANVRTFTAEQLYLSLMTYQSDLEENLAALSGSNAISGGGGGVKDYNESAISAEDNDDELASVMSKVTTSTTSAATTGTAGSPMAGKLDLEAAMEVLSSTNWSQPLEKVKPVRDQICAHLLVRL